MTRQYPSFITRHYRPLILLAGLAALISLLVMMAVPPTVSLTGDNMSMLSLHLLMELFAIIIAVLIVIVSWHTFDSENAQASKILIGGFIVVATCDMIHALSYAGMPNFISPSSTPRAIFYWLMGRTFESLTMAMVAFSVVLGISRLTSVLGGISVAAFLVWFGSFQLALFPTVFIPGEGVTAFKANYEYVLSAANVLLALVFWRRASTTGRDTDYLLALSSFVMGIGELMFTAYVAPSDFQNIFGHLYKVIAYALLYRATFVTGIRAPFNAVQRSEAKLRNSEARLRLLGDNLPRSVIYQYAFAANGDKRFLHISETAEQIYGITASALQCDANVLDRLTEPEDLHRLEAARVASAKDHVPIDEDVRLQRPDGQWVWIHISAAPRVLEDGTVLWDGIDTDVSEAKKAQEEIVRLGYYDRLTGLPNRRLMQDRLGQSIAHARRTGHYSALLFIDLDNFKDLNDTLGHDTGDTILLTIAARITANVRDVDTVSRIGGDEFVVLIDGETFSETMAADEAQSVAEKILLSLGESLMLAGQPRYITASVGICIFGPAATSTDELMRSADLALYEAKNAGRNAIRFFDPSMQSAIASRMGMEMELRAAIVHQQFAVHYQPQVDAAGKVVGAEVLVRWQHPERGMVSPAQFIPLAEETGLILPLGHWVLEQACRQLAQWSQTPHLAHLALAVNVSARQFSLPNFTEEVLALVEGTGAKPSLLKLELTEGMLVDNTEEVIAKMAVLKQHGLRFSLDDFGTGFSSLSYLKRLPLDQLKIDQSFVRDLLADSSDASIVRTVIALGSSLSLEVIAEGVETAEQRDYLATLGCHCYQGYLFGKPLPLNGFMEMLATQA